MQGDRHALCHSREKKPNLELKLARTMMGKNRHF